VEHLKSLEKLGLKDKEQDIYFAALQLGKATANSIAYRANIKRPTTYDILERLKKDNFVFETKENNKRIFVANSPDKLISNLDEQKRDLQSDLPMLKSIYNLKAARPKIAYFEGLDGIKHLFEDTLTVLNKGDEILAYVTRDTAEALPKYIEDYVARRVKKGIKLRGIYEDVPILRPYLTKNKEQLRTTKLVDPKKFLIKNEINIYANKIIINTYKPEPFGVLIESAEIADTQKAIFEMAWQGLK